MSVSGSPKLLTPAEETFLSRRPEGRIATLDCVDGYPHCVAVDFVYQDGRIYFGTGPRTRKVRNLLGDPRVAFEVDVNLEVGREGSRLLDWRGIMVKGRARVIEDPSMAARIIRSLLEKYPGNTYDDDTVVVEIRPERKYAWGPWEELEGTE
jgi:nitroimidazol reductase NimA-like FMN-containing flavoprotein (pyridoxamine 5'-phosphate oxidase superfamily)